MNPFSPCHSLRQTLMRNLGPIYAEMCILHQQLLSKCQNITTHQLIQKRFLKRHLDSPPPYVSPPSRITYFFNASLHHTKSYKTMS